MLRSELCSAGEKSPSPKHEGKHETILGLTFRAAGSAEKQIKVKVDAFYCSPLRNRARLYSKWHKIPLAVTVQKALQRSSKYVKKCLKFFTFFTILNLSLCNFAL